MPVLRCSGVSGAFYHFGDVGLLALTCFYRRSARWVVASSQEGRWKTKILQPC